MCLVEGTAHGRNDFALEVVQVLIGKCLLRVTAPRDGYMKGLEVAATSFKLVGELVGVAQDFSFSHEL
jgi:hypothetical protein